MKHRTNGWRLQFFRGGKIAPQPGRSFYMKDRNTEPDGFSDLCRSIGLAVLMGQKVQYALASYYVVFMSVRKQIAMQETDVMLDMFLSNPMGKVIGEIRKNAPLSQSLDAQVNEFQKKRNWLVHDFDEESTPHIVRGQGIHEYIHNIQEIVAAAEALLHALDKVGVDLLREIDISPEHIRTLADQKRK